MVAVQHQLGHIATLNEACFLEFDHSHVPFLLLFGIERLKWHSQLLWGKIIDGPVLITAMDDLQQGDRVGADAGINLGCIHERQCSKTDADCHLAVGLVWYA